MRRVAVARGKNRMVVVQVVVLARLHDWMRFYREHPFESSMNRRGNCWDNAVAESFFSSLKKERIKNGVFVP